ncbi:MAG: hypothetical protein U1E27_07790, partial [Kiritimatiellia bacterium]|nr:hypothetical protein [Kiritimatiellia bacterium]
QTVPHGASGGAVTAVPHFGYRFARWSDGDTNPVRSYASLAGPVSVTAEFELDLLTVAAESALASIEEDLRWEFQTQNGIQRYVDTPMAPTWTAMASQGGTEPVDLAVGPALEHIPGVALTAWDGVTNTMNRPVWKNIESNGQIIGRQAYLIVDCSGLLDVTAIGQKDRAPFENDSRGIPLTHELLDEFPDAASVAAFQAILGSRGPIQSLPELRQAMADAGAGEPQLAFFTSYSPNHEWYDNYHQYVRPRVAWGTNLVSVQANKEMLREELITGTRSFYNDMRRAGTPYWDVRDNVNNFWFLQASDFDPWFSSLEDYLDDDWIPRSVTSYNNEPVPLISEIIFTNRISSAQSGSDQLWTNTLDIVVEIAYPHPNLGNDRTYDLEIQVRTRFGDPKVATAGYEIIEMRADEPRGSGYPESATWLPNEYRLYAIQLSTNLVTTTTPRSTIYELNIRVRDRLTAALVDQALLIQIDSRDIMNDADGNSIWNGIYSVPMDVQGVASKTPIGYSLSEHANWDDTRFRLRKQLNYPETGENWTNVITPGFFNIQSYLDDGITSGVNTWLAYSRSQDRLDHLSEIFRMGYRPNNAGLSFLDSYRAPTYSTSGRYGHRDRQFWDRFTTTTNLPDRGYINPNSRHSNVLAHAYFNLPYQWFAGNDGFLKRAVNPAYQPGLAEPHAYAFDFEERVFNAETALNFGRKQRLDRDLVFPAPLNGPRQRTTYQYMGWYDPVVLNQAKHYEKFGLWPLPTTISFCEMFPHRRSISAQSIDMGPEWQTAHWTRNHPLSFPAPSQGLLPPVIQPPLDYDVNAVGSEGYIHLQTLHGQFSELMNPRQNLFTIILATQEIEPRPLGSEVTEEDVISEERAALVVWRDPWPTVPEGATESPDFDKAQRTHKIRILRAHLLQERAHAIRLGGGLSFGETPLGESSERILTIHNAGFEPLVVTGMDVPEGFSGNWSGTIPAYGFQQVPVTFS